MFGGAKTAALGAFYYFVSGQTIIDGCFFLTAEILLVRWHVLFGYSDLALYTVKKLWKFRRL